MSRRLFKSMHVMHRWWSLSQACKADRAECLLHDQLFSASCLSVQHLPPREQLTYFTLHHPAKTKAPQPVNEWEHPHSHIHRPANLLNPINYYLTFLPSYCYSQVVLNNVAPHTISAKHRALQTLHTLTLPTIFHRFFLFNINKPHSTLNKYKTGQSLNSL